MYIVDNCSLLSMTGSESASNHVSITGDHFMWVTHQNPRRSAVFTKIGRVLVVSSFQRVEIHV